LDIDFRTVLYLFHNYYKTITIRVAEPLTLAILRRFRFPDRTLVLFLVLQQLHTNMQSTTATGTEQSGQSYDVLLWKQKSEDVCTVTRFEILNILKLLVQNGKTNSRGIQEEKSIFWEMGVSVIVRRGKISS
jgi:hypothetical protein